jgi:hypothetical protein
VDGSALAMRRWSIRLVLALVVGLVFAFGWSKEAHAISNVDRTQFTSNFCVEERSSTYKSSNRVFFGESITRPFSGFCSSELSKPAGYIAGRVKVWKWNSRTEEWEVCRRTDWKYNAERTDEHVVRARLVHRSGRWCGRGYYGTEAQGSVWHNGEWNTTPWVWSGYDYFG